MKRIAEFKTVYLRVIMVIFTLSFIMACNDKNADLKSFADRNLPVVEHNYETMVDKYFTKKGKDTCVSIKSDYKKSYPETNEATLLYLEGYCYYQSDEKEDKDTIIILRKAFELAPNDKQGVNHYALISYRQDKDDDIIKVHQYALTLNPESLDLYTQLAATYEGVDETVELLKKGIEYAKKNNNKALLASLYYELAEMYENEDEYNNAIKNYQLAIDNKEPPDADYYNNIAMVYDDKEDYEMAIKMYKKSILLDKSDVCTYSNLGYAYNNDKQYKAARKTIRQGLAVDKGDSCDGMAYYNLGVTYRKSDCEQANKHFLKALEEGAGEYDDSTKNGILYNIGRCHVELKNYDDGIKYLRKDTTLDEDNYLYLGKAYLGKNELGAAEENLKLSIEEYDTGEALELLGEINFTRKNFKSAKDFFKRATKADTGISLAYARLGIIAGAEEEYDQAVNYYKKAIKNLKEDAPEKTEYQRQLYIIHIKNGHCNEAKALQASLSSSSDYSALTSKLEQCVTK